MERLGGDLVTNRTYDNVRVLAINLGWEQANLLRALGERGFEVWGVHYDDNYKQYIDYQDVLVCDIRDLDTILDYAHAVDPDAVISNQDDYAQFAQALVAQRLGLPGPRIDAAQVAGNKYLQRRRCDELDLPIPAFSLCAYIDDAYEFAKAQGYPIVLKPVDNRGGIGVHHVADEGQLEDAFTRALIASPSRLVLAEQFVRGTQIVIDGYARPGSGCRSLALGTKRMFQEPSVVAEEIAYPGKLSESTYRAAMNLNERLNEALGLQFGPTHSEYIITDDNDIVLIETANRGGGVHISEVIVPVVSGFDLVGGYIDDVLGVANGELPAPVRNPVMMRFLSFPPGTIRTIDGADNLLEEPDVLHLQLTVGPGDTIGNIENDRDRHGYIIVATDDSRRVDRLIDRIDVKYHRHDTSPKVHTVQP